MGALLHRRLAYGFRGWAADVSSRTRYLHHLASVMARVESLSHVLAWATYDDRHALGRGDAISQSELRLVSLPRLKLTFQAIRVGEAVRPTPSAT